MLQFVIDSLSFTHWISGKEEYLVDEYLFNIIVIIVIINDK